MNTFLWYFDPVIHIPYDIIPSHLLDVIQTPEIFLVTEAVAKGTEFLKNSSNAMMDGSIDIYSLV